MGTANGTAIERAKIVNDSDARRQNAAPSNLHAAPGHHHHHQRLRNAHGGKEHHRASRDLSVQNAKAQNDEATSDVDKVVQRAGAVVSDVAKSTTNGVKDAMQGASKVATSVFAKFVGMFGRADPTANPESATQSSTSEHLASSDTHDHKNFA